MSKHNDTLKKSAGCTLETAVRRILRVWDAATPEDVAAGAAWYADAHAVALSIAPRVGGAEHAAAVIAHLSPRTSWARNVAGAVDLANGVEPVYCIASNRERAHRALKSSEPLATLNGPKTRRFALNILGDRSAVTVDVWAARVALESTTRTNWRGVESDAEKILTRRGVYDALEHAYRLAASRRGVDATTMQATTWIVARNGRAN